MDGVNSERGLEATESAWGGSRRIAFYAAIAVPLVSIGLLFWKVNLFWILAWLPGDFLEGFYASQLEFDHVVGPFVPHIIHYLALSASHVMVLVGLALQLTRPRTNVAAVWQTAGGLFLSVLTLPFVLVSVGPSHLPLPILVVIALVVAAGLLHPANPVRKLPRPADQIMTGLWAIAAIPAFLLTISQIRLELNGVPADPHWQGLHYNFMAEFGLHVVLAGLLGASALSGWRYSAWTASFMVALLGMGFTVYPDLPGSQGPGWGVAMIVWAVLYLAVGEMRRRREDVSARSYRPAAQPTAP